tara:strand:+ start:1243 stop:1584 length:342 start_codon:yes stop_codon:yes gene_type:complete
MKTWTINSLSTLNVPEPETAVMSNFTIAEDGQSVTYSVNLLPADAANFTPYADITQAQAIGWTQDALGAERVAAMEAEVDALIAQAAIPAPQPQPLPWVAPEEVAEVATEEAA